MNYNDTVSWMFRQLPMYQNAGAAAYKKDLNNTLKFSKHLGNPHHQFKSVHVAGTNGKGSTSHMLASVLQESGYKVGLYTSPHLKDFRERIKINGEEVSEDFVVDFIGQNKTFIVSNKLSFFELTVVMAFAYFARQNVDIAIVEVGMGGRLDSTNIILPIVSVITNIGLDHTQFLGGTLAEIATEKAGIIKPKVPVVIGETHHETKTVFKVKSKTAGAELYFADELVKTLYQSDLKGIYQKHNIKTLVQTVRVLRTLGFNISDSSLKRGLLRVVSNTGLKGRWQILQYHPKIICDTAHNKEGLQMVMDQLKTEKYTNLHIVFGVVKDKDLKAIVSLLPREAAYYLCKPDIPRGLDVASLKQVFQNLNYNCKAYDSVDEAFQVAKSKASEDDLIYVGGSTFVVAEVV
jgi:dihydrofolate synthase/folylpolyglutamate synthase